MENRNIRKHHYEAIYDIDSPYIFEDPVLQNSLSTTNLHSFLNNYFPYNLNTYPSQYLKNFEASLRFNLEREIARKKGNVWRIKDFFKIIDIKQKIKLFSDSEKNISLLIAAYHKEKYFTELLLNEGADVNYVEPESGLTALHLSSFSGCESCVKLLLSKGAIINFDEYQFSPLHMAVIGNWVNIVEILIKRKENAEFLKKEITIYSLLSTAARFNSTKCIELLLKKKAEKIANQTPLHIAAAEGDSNKVKYLIQTIGVNTKNSKGQTPLHLAALTHSRECLEILLNDGNADPNITDNENKSCLHYVFSKDFSSTLEMINLLLRKKVNVNVKDKSGITPLHLAVLNNLPLCMQLLTKNNADISESIKSKASLDVMFKFVKGNLNRAVTFECCDDEFNEPFTNDFEIKLDFSFLLQKEGEYTQNRKEEEMKVENNSKIQTAVLKTLIDKGLEEIITHPLCESFVYMKWRKISIFYRMRLFMFGLFNFAFTMYVYMVFAEKCHERWTHYEGKAENTSTEKCSREIAFGELLYHNPLIIRIAWYLLIAMAFCEILRSLISFMFWLKHRKFNFKHFKIFLSFVMEWLFAASIFCISNVYYHDLRTHSWQTNIGAFCIIIGWGKMMLLIGRLPVFTPYVQMTTKIINKFLIIFTLYACIFIGFTLSFSIFLPAERSFFNPLIGFIKIMIMMTGEIDMDMIPEKYNSTFLGISSRIAFFLFVLFVTIILMNLLVGLAVEDIQSIQKWGEISRLTKQINLIFHIEDGITILDYFSTKFNFRNWYSLPQTISVKPFTNKECTLPKNILENLFEIARKQRYDTFKVVTNWRKFSKSSFK